MVRVRVPISLYLDLLPVEKLSLITSEECIESNVIPIEAVKFLEEETRTELADQASNGNDHDGDDEEDLVGSSISSRSFSTLASILVRPDLRPRFNGLSTRHSAF